MALQGSTLSRLGGLLDEHPKVVGFAEHEVETADGKPAIRVYLAEAADDLPRHIDDLPVEPLVVGRPEYQAGAAVGVGAGPKERTRPLVGGISISAADSGTLGYFVKRSGSVCLLSCEHVLKAGTADVLQQSRVDGGTAPADVVAQWAFAIDDGPTGVDAGVATLADPHRFTRELMGLGPVTGKGSVKTGDTVQKSGKNSGVTSGKVDAVAATITIDKVTYQHQICVIGTPKPFSIGGDSGSLVVTTDVKAVGIVMAGSNASSWVNPIDIVLKALGDATLV